MESNTLRRPWSTSLLLFWVALLYFAEGLPFGLFFDLFPVWMRTHQFSLSSIGTLSLFGLAWSLKFLWAPLIDRFLRHHWWIFGVNLIMGFCFLFFSFHAEVSSFSWLVFGLYVFCAATNDISIDGVTILISGNNQIGRVNAVRNMAYRVGLILAGALLSVSQLLGWRGTFAISAVILWINACLVLFMPAHKQQKSTPGLSVEQEFSVLLKTPAVLFGLTALLVGMVWPVFIKLSTTLSTLQKSNVSIKLVPVVLIVFGIWLVSQRTRSMKATQLGPTFGPFLRLLKKPGILGAIAFVLLYKVGEAAAGFMIKPFWLDAGFSKGEIGWFSVNLGVILSILGGIVGGWYVDRNNIIKSIWVSGIIQTLSNLLYALAAYIALPHLPGTPVTADVRFAVYCASAFDSFTSGLGSAVFLTYLMKIIDKEHATSEYAILSSIFAFSRSISGWLGGISADTLGYATYFLLTFFLCYPAYLFIPYVKKTLSGQLETPSSS